MIVTVIHCGKGNRKNDGNLQKPLVVVDGSIDFLIIQYDYRYTVWTLALVKYCESQDAFCLSQLKFSNEYRLSETDTVPVAIPMF